MRRRRIIAVAAGGLTASLAGCLEEAIDWLAGQVLEEVNLFNETDRPVSGTVTVEAPAGTEVLAASFDLEAGDGDLDGEDAGATYDDVLTNTGEYTVSVSLDAPIDGVDEATEVVTIDDPDEEFIVIGLGSPGEVDEAVVILAVESFTDLGDALT